MIRAVVFALASLSAAASACAETVNIYSTRQPALIAHVLAAFTDETGIKTRVLFIKSGLAERVKAEGAASPADLLMTVDIGNLDQAKTAEITQPLPAFGNIPRQFADPEGHWFGLTTRSRVIYASVDRVGADAITYEELAGPEYAGRLCTRSGQHPYNIGLFASLVAHHGAEGAERIIAGYKANRARKPQGNDRAQAKGIFSGECDVALGNSYYVGLMLTNDKEPEQKDWAAAMKVIFPNNAGRGAHMNISGMALAKHAPNKQATLELMEFLASNAAQAIYAEQVFEYPVNPAAPVSNIVADFGEVKRDALPLAEIAARREIASRIVDRVGYDN